MTTLQKRLLFSAVLVTITLLTIFFSPAWFFFVVITSFGLIGFSEFMDVAEKKGVIINRLLALSLAALVPFSVCYSSEIFVISLAMLALFAFHFNKKYSLHQAVSHSMVTIFGMIYVVLFFSQLIKMRGFDHGPVWVFYTILVVKTGDAGAYFVGSKIGKTKLIEHISPNKSVEGAMAGFLTSVIFSLLSKAFLPHVPTFHFLIMGGVLGVLSQVADLSESLIKRDAGVKDSGQIPGLGGILDVLDSLILTIPFVVFYIQAFLL